MVDFTRSWSEKTNLIDNPNYSAEVGKFRKELLVRMVRTGDPALDAFSNRQNPEALMKFMAEQDLRAGKR